MVVIFGKPFGATDIRTFCKRLGQSSPGNTPRAGRFTNAGKKFCAKKKSPELGQKNVTNDRKWHELTFKIVLIGENIQQLGMIVAKWNRWDLCVNIKQNIAIHVNQIIALWFIIISEQLYRSSILNK